MDVLQYNILNRRKQFKKRRNVIRRVFLVLLLLFFFYSLYVLYNYPQNKKPELIIKNNYLLSNVYLHDFLAEKVENINPYFINPRTISVSFYKSVPLVKTVVVRKYLLPKYKIIVYLIEKNIWAKVNFNDIQSNLNVKNYLTEDGCLIFDDYLNKSNLKSDLVKVYLSKKFLSDRTKLKELFKLYGYFVNKLKFPISAIYLNDNLDVYVFTNYGFQVKCGKLDQFLKDRVFKLKNVPQVINSLKAGEYRSGYIDLNLDRAAVIKTNDIIESMDNPPKKKSLFSLFQRGQDN